MNEEIVEQWEEMMENFFYTADDNGIHISLPVDEFNRFEQLFNLYFKSEEEDLMFKNWQDRLE